jgi:hypothetical protein
MYMHDMMYTHSVQWYSSYYVHVLEYTKVNCCLSVYRWTLFSIILYTLTV